jgi:hypothetical protein
MWRAAAREQRNHRGLIDGDHLVPFGRRELGGRLADRGAGVVHQHIDAAETLRKLVEEAVDLGFERDVERMSFGIPQRERGLLRFLEVEIDQNGARTRRHECFGGCPADSARAAGDHGHLSVQPKAVEH